MRKKLPWLFLLCVLSFGVVCAFYLPASLAQQSRSGPDSPARETASEQLPVKELLVAGADAGYVDGAVCAGCHSEIAETFLQTGMGRSFSRLRRENIEADFTNRNTLFHAKSERYYTAYERDGKYYLRRHQVGFDGSEVHRVEKEIHYVIGSGRHGRSYLHKTKDGRLLQLPVSWYSESGGFWAMSPGYDQPDHMGFRREVNHECMACHNAYPEIERGSDGFGRRATFPGRIPEGIDCQRCHGPGGDHVRAITGGASSEKIRGAIVNPSRLPAERQLEVCMQCHLETTSRRLPHSLVRHGRGAFSYRPGAPLEDYRLHFDHAPGAGYDDKFEVVQSVYRLRKSACFQASKGALTCTTCHNPHHAPRGDEAVRQYSGVCRDCHGEAVASLANEGKHPSTTECLSCHMPRRRTEDAVHSVMTDHYIQRRLPEGDPLAPLTEKRDSGENAYRGEVVLYYPPELPATPESQLYLAVAQVKDQSNLAAGIQRLEQAIQRHEPAKAEFYFELAEAYLKAGRFNRAVRFYEQALARRPTFALALRQLGFARLLAGDLPRAAERTQAAHLLIPHDAEILNTLGEIRYQQGRLDDAVAAFRRAANLDPEMAEVYNNLGASWLVQGKPVEAEKSFREAVRSRPDFPAASKNLAEVLARREDFRESQYYFEMAIRLDPAFLAARQAYANELIKREMFDRAEEQLQVIVDADGASAEVHNNLGTLRDRKGNMEGAAQQYESAIRADPAFARPYFNLGVISQRRGKLAEAIAYYRDAVTQAPNYFQAHLSLGRLLAATGQVEKARHHLQQAVRSSNPSLREAARQALASVGATR